VKGLKRFDQAFSPATADWAQEYFPGARGKYDKIVAGL
jgi:hypothetical protein